MLSRKNGDGSSEPDHFRRYDQVVHLGWSPFLPTKSSRHTMNSSFLFPLARAVRNPLDAIASYYHFENAARLANGAHDHTAKITNLVKFGEGERKRILFFAERWIMHARYWAAAPIETHTMR